LVPSEGIASRLPLDSYHLLSGELLHDPRTTKPSQAAVLLPAEGRVRRSMHRCIVDVREAGLNLAREGEATSKITRKHCTGEAIVRLVSKSQCMRFIFGTNHRNHRAKQLALAQLAVIVDFTKDMRW